MLDSSRPERDFDGDEDEDEEEDEEDEEGDEDEEDEEGEGGEEDEEEEAVGDHVKAKDDGKIDGEHAEVHGNATTQVTAEGDPGANESFNPKHAEGLVQDNAVEEADDERVLQGEGEGDVNEHPGDQVGNGESEAVGPDGQEHKEVAPPHGAVGESEDEEEDGEDLRESNVGVGAASGPLERDSDGHVGVGDVTTPTTLDDCAVLDGEDAAHQEDAADDAAEGRIGLLGVHHEEVEDQDVAAKMSVEATGAEEFVDNNSNSAIGIDGADETSDGNATAPHVATMHHYDGEDSGEDVIVEGGEGVKAQGDHQDVEHAEEHGSAVEASTSAVSETPVSFDDSKDGVRENMDGDVQLTRETMDPEAVNGGHRVENFLVVGHDKNANDGVEDPAARGVDDAVVANSLVVEHPEEVGDANAPRHGLDGADMGDRMEEDAEALEEDAVAGDALNVVAADVPAAEDARLVPDSDSANTEGVGGHIVSENVDDEEEGEDDLAEGDGHEGVLTNADVTLTIPTVAETDGSGAYNGEASKGGSIHETAELKKVSFRCFSCADKVVSTKVVDNFGASEASGLAEEVNHEKNVDEHLSAGGALTGAIGGEADTDYDYAEKADMEDAVGSSFGDSAEKGEGDDDGIVVKKDIEDAEWAVSADATAGVPHVPSSQLDTVMDGAGAGLDDSERERDADEASEVGHKSIKVGERPVSTGDEGEAEGHAAIAVVAQPTEVDIVGGDFPSEHQNVARLHDANKEQISETNNGHESFDNSVDGGVAKGLQEEGANVEVGIRGGKYLDEGGHEDVAADAVKGDNFERVAADVAPPPILDGNDANGDDDVAVHAKAVLVAEATEQLEMDEGVLADGQEVDRVEERAAADVSTTAILTDKTNVADAHELTPKAVRTPDMDVEADDEASSGPEMHDKLEGNDGSRSDVSDFANYYPEEDNQKYAGHDALFNRVAATATENDAEAIQVPEHMVRIRMYDAAPVEEPKISNKASGKEAFMREAHKSAYFGLATPPQIHADDAIDDTLTERVAANRAHLDIIDADIESARDEISEIRASLASGEHEAEGSAQDLKADVATIKEDLAEMQIERVNVVKELEGMVGEMEPAQHPSVLVVGDGERSREVDGESNERVDLSDQVDGGSGVEPGDVAPSEEPAVRALLGHFSTAHEVINERSRGFGVANADKERNAELKAADPEAFASLQAVQASQSEGAALVSTLKGDVESRNDRIRALEEAAAAAAAADANLRTEHANEIAALRLQLEEAQKNHYEVADAYKQLHLAHDEKLATISNLETEVERHRGVIEEHRGRIAELEVAHSEAAGSFREIQAAHDEKATHIESLKADVDVKDGRIRELEQQVATAAQSRIREDSEIAALRLKLEESQTEEQRVVDVCKQLQSAHDEKAAQVGDLQAEVESYRAAVEEHRGRIADIEGAHHEVSAKLRDIQASDDEKAARIENLMADVDLNYVRVRALEEAVVVAEAASRGHEDEAAELRVQMSETFKAYEKLQTAHTEQAARMSDLEAELNSHKVEIQGHRGRIAELEAAYEEASGAFKEFQATLDEKTAHIEILTAELNTKHQRIKSLESTVATEMARRADQDGEIAELRSQVEVARANYQRANDAMERVQQMHDEKAARVGELENNVEAHVTQLSHLQSEMDNHRDRLGQVTGDHSDLTAALRELQLSHDAKVSQIGLLEEDLAQHRVKVLKLASERSEAQDVAAKLMESQRVVETLRDEVAALSEKHNASLDELNELHAAHAEKEARIEKLTAERGVNQEYIAELQATQSSAVMLEDEVVKLREDLERSKAQRETLAKEMEFLLAAHTEKDSQIGALAVEVADHRKRALEASDEVLPLKAKIQELQESIETFKNRAAELTRAHDEKGMENETLRQETESHLATIADLTAAADSRQLVNDQMADKIKTFLEQLGLKTEEASKVGFLDAQLESARARFENALREREALTESLLESQVKIGSLEEEINAQREHILLLEARANTAMLTSMSMTQEDRDVEGPKDYILPRELVDLSGTVEKLAEAEVDKLKIELDVAHKELEEVNASLNKLQVTYAAKSHEAEVLQAEVENHRQRIRKLPIPNVDEEEKLKAHVLELEGQLSEQIEESKALRETVAFLEEEGLSYQQMLDESAAEVQALQQRLSKNELEFKQEMEELKIGNFNASKKIDESEPSIQNLTLRLAESETARREASAVADRLRIELSALRRLDAAPTLKDTLKDRSVPSELERIGSLQRVTGSELRRSYSSFSSIQKEASVRSEKGKEPVRFEERTDREDTTFATAAEEGTDASMSVVEDPEGLNSTPTGMDVKTVTDVFTSSPKDVTPPVSVQGAVSKADGKAFVDAAIQYELDQVEKDLLIATAATSGSSELSADQKRIMDLEHQVVKLEVDIAYMRACASFAKIAGPARASGVGSGVVTSVADQANLRNSANVEFDLKPSSSSSASGSTSKPAIRRAKTSSPLVSRSSTMDARVAPGGVHEAPMAYRSFSMSDASGVPRASSPGGASIASAPPAIPDRVSFEVDDMDPQLFLPSVFFNDLVPHGSVMPADGPVDHPPHALVAMQRVSSMSSREYTEELRREVVVLDNKVVECKRKIAELRARVTELEGKVAELRASDEQARTLAAEAQNKLTESELKRVDVEAKLNDLVDLRRRKKMTWFLQK
ncbi:hypothetical protein HK101_002848 [Irineochytrium annulatum]|nr:hypothetical protein HK101_002848 [Irineochytrium annulatum]